ncbi:asparagine synthase (glutamine-hydrolyzing) [Micromonospora yangpuensis]|uniref:asparagine synthase (glutamine-hydrolyzing) n=1 Tax=Micromonospora yangpuensis TaxID=683228 RepID=A0A1C6VHK2_9ACTN|nr:asparagine synthase (glutamine-hydrolyzing) [Micromonospora yangpuensis]GGL99751.1 asparagine synthetase B [Micromonospora yangpuensis]SCL65772.1 asparagine synthase (glutamine-hydrolysing) [Micromonospora yangpuensis]
MCGIAGWVSYDRDLARHQADLDAMTATMACRGPDAAGVQLDRHAGLGHRRLAVIDIDGGTQPMAVQTDDGTVTITYSGEVYNFGELRGELRRRGHRFRTRSDTEVVLHGYLEWGEAVAERLNGMYAFAVWDSRVEKLVLIRDRLGVKPLYYYRTDDGVLFGSEPKAILANPLAERVVDLAGIRELVSFTQTPGSAVWCGMNEVLPGGIVTVDRAGLREHRYWTLPSRPHTDDLQTTIANVRSLLGDVVERQLVSDVPRCTLLSGGLDSSAITAIAAAKLGERGEKVRSFAVDFTGREDDFVADDLRATTDAPYAREVSAHVGSLHESVVLNHQDIADPAVRRAVITARDSPLSLGDMDTSLYLLFQAIRQHSTVALSGESADEVFGGYRWFFQPEAQAAATFPWMAVFVSGAKAQVSDRFNADITAALDLPSYIRDRYAEALTEIERVDGESDHEFRMREMCYLHLTRFVRMLLERKDRISMAVGLEVRVPFCDHRLVEYVYNTPWSMKTFDGREKSLLRAATADLLPRSVLDRVKAPYPATLDPMYTSALLQQCRDLLATDSPVFNLVDRTYLEDITRESGALPIEIRNGMERVLDLSTWLDIYRPELRF